MKKSLLVLLLAVFSTIGWVPTLSFAYLSNIPILENEDYVKLSDEALTSAYLEVIIEIEAIAASHVVQVFSPKEYQQYKDFLRYKYELKKEFMRRQIEIPNIKD